MSVAREFQAPGPLCDSHHGLDSGPSLPVSRSTALAGMSHWRPSWRAGSSPRRIAWRMVSRESPSRWATSGTPRTRGRSLIGASIRAGTWPPRLRLLGRWPVTPVEGGRRPPRLLVSYIAVVPPAIPPAKAKEARSAARAALAELDAPEPNPEPAQLLGGELRLDDRMLQIHMVRDPANAACCRPHVMSACQRLDQLGYGAPGLRCACGHGLGFISIPALSTRAQVAWSGRRLPPRLRGGAWRDFAPIDNDFDPRAAALYAPWTMDSWEVALATGKSGPRTAAQTAGISGDRASRQTFTCRRCRASYTQLNVTLLRMVLQAISEGADEVTFGTPAGTQLAARSYAERAPDRGSARAWSTRERRRK